MELSKAKPWQRGSFWWFPMICGAVGALVPPCIYGLGHRSWLFDEMSRNSGALLIFCPPYLLSMSFDYMQAKDRIETVTFIMSPANGVLYFFVGVLLKFFGKLINRF
jgi:hypothetical protein